MLITIPTAILIVIFLFIVLIVVIILIALGIIKSQEKEMGGEVKKEPGINKLPEDDN